MYVSIRIGHQGNPHDSWLAQHNWAKTKPIYMQEVATDYNIAAVCSELSMGAKGPARGSTVQGSWWHLWSAYGSVTNDLQSNTELVVRILAACANKVAMQLGRQVLLLHKQALSHNLLLVVGDTTQERKRNRTSKRGRLKRSLLVVSAFNCKDSFRTEKIDTLLCQKFAEPQIHIVHIKVSLQLNANRGHWFIMLVLLTLFLESSMWYTETHLGMPTNACVFSLHIVRAMALYLHEVWLHLKDLLQTEGFYVQHAVKVHFTPDSLHDLCCTIDSLHLQLQISQNGACNHCTAL